MMKSLLTILLLAGFAAGCMTKVEIPLRPKTVPNEAYWAGGVDGGNWFLISSAGQNRYNVKIWNDFTGDLEGKGIFELKKDDRIDASGSTAASFWDGNSIYLENKSRLIPIKGAAWFAFEYKEQTPVKWADPN